MAGWADRAGADLSLQNNCYRQQRHRSIVAGTDVGLVLQVYDTRFCTQQVNNMELERQGRSNAPLHLSCHDPVMAIPATITINPTPSPPPVEHSPAALPP